VGSLAGRVAIVTGASRGIGKGCALELAAAGASVYLTGRTLEEGASALPGSIRATAAELTAAGGRGVAVQCDHRDDAQVEALFARVHDEAGRLDVLVNNAFLIPKELTSGLPFWEAPISNWDDMLDVGTRSAYVASRFAARIMVPQQRGLIANISSSGAAEYAWHVAYGVGKAALDRLTADTAHELGMHGVAVVSLWPGLVMTERIQTLGGALAGLDTSGAESQRFTGRAVAALAADPEVFSKTGQALLSRALADEYRFTDVDGNLPKGPMHARPEGVAGSPPPPRLERGRNGS
jgi:NAD(P)-dependent dehydrogenase (short-subunit alcohol dehydrogenase family)